ncbi:hypothetical protein HHA01_22730 [Halomonas halmophila]|uniref:Uncharacterized protein n=1 Tax=Halomonas halmophila TaxID=252 RepID=A0A4Y4F1N9_9GAMM|nr:hypothetical protein HHA01_22730 [Halomonas halmophila]
MTPRSAKKARTSPINRARSRNVSISAEGRQSIDIYVSSRDDKGHTRKNVALQASPAQLAPSPSDAQTRRLMGKAAEFSSAK